MKRYDVYGVGSALVDTEIKVNDIFLQQLGIAKGVMTLVDEARQEEILQRFNSGQPEIQRACGGSAANTVIAQQLFGGASFLSCRTADDEDGHFYRSDLHRAGVAHNPAEKTEDATGKCLVMVTPDAERTMNTCLGISEKITGADLVPEALADSRYLYLEGYLVTSPNGHATALQARQIAAQHDVMTALSFSDPTIVASFADSLKEIIGSGVDFLFCNEDEALCWTGTDRLEDAEDALRKAASCTVVTRGARGARILNGSSWTDIPPRRVQAVDTNGAGDMFAGAFLYGLAQNRTPAEAGRLASYAAAEIVRHYGPRLPHEQYPAILQQFEDTR